MDNLEKYLSVIKRQIPNIEERLNGKADKTKLDKIAEEMGCELLPEFVELYSRFDGEDFAEYTGFIAGLEFLSLDGIISHMNFFKNSDYEMTAMGTKAIAEEPMGALKWIPFAYDNGRAYFAIDMSPADKGKQGQIIAVDYDFCYSYLLAGSLTELFGKMTGWFEDGILTVNTEDGDTPFITESTGNIFNSLEELTETAGKDDGQEIDLYEGFWQKRYGSARVPVSVLLKEKSMHITEKTLSCEPFAYMENLKELVFHDCALWHPDSLAKAPQLKTLIFVNCVFANTDLSALLGAPKLKSLCVSKMDAKGLMQLSRISTLKDLTIINVTGIELNELAAFTGIQALSIWNMGLHDGSFIGNLRNLKKLDLQKHTMDNLDFLKNLTALTEFNLINPALNEDGLSAVGELKDLKEFIYPVKNLRIYAGHPTLESVGIAPDAGQNFEVFKDSKVNSFTVCGNINNEELENISKKMNQYVRIYSYGSKA